MRPSGRAPDALRDVTIETGVSRHAEGSCLIRMGGTHVLCTASLEESVPPFLRKTGLGWVTAEYGMLPRATTTRNRREAAAGKQTGRTIEIQRLIGRSLRAGVDRVALGERQITVDCDVLQADGGTRCAAITGGWVALRLAVNALMGRGDVKSDPLSAHVAAVSCGVYGGVAGARPRLRRGQRGGDRRELRDDRRPASWSRCRAAPRARPSRGPNSTGCSISPRAACARWWRRRPKRWR